MRVLKYIKSSIEKLKNDAFAKASYDLIKYLIIIFLTTSGVSLMGIWLSFLGFMFYPITIQLFVLILILLITIMLTIILYNIQFKRKYQELKIDNHTDELTGLKNHKALKEYLLSALESHNDSSSLSLILIDVDNFKKFNSDTSHSVADQVLKKLGELLGNDKRVTDETFRYFLRGDEFIVVAKETNLHQAYQAAERKRTLISNHGFEVEGNIYSLTVSCGITELKKDDDYESFTDRVSKALNLAKQEKKKNCTKSLN